MLRCWVRPAGHWLLYLGGLPGNLHECLTAVHPAQERGKKVSTSSGLPLPQLIKDLIHGVFHMYIHICTAWKYQSLAFPGCTYMNSEQVPTVAPAWAFTDKAKGMK